MKRLNIILPILGVVAIGGGALLALNSCGKETYRSNLDKYVEIETEAMLKAHPMNPGLSVYVDFSDGMNAAYGTEVSREALQKVVNTFTDADGKASFFSLANNEITPLEMSQTQLYNAIMSSASYKKTMAPIEQTLKRIVEKSQAALLITDFEEYNGGVIQQQAYAKSYFVEWLKKGFNITFYKIDYKEGAKPKHLFFTVFDSPLNNLSSKVEQSLSGLMSHGIEKFVINAPDCSFTLASNYITSTVGGNYHDNAGKDNITGVLEDGTEEAFITYTGNLKATASLSNGYTVYGATYGPLTQYYPFGVNHKNVIENIEAFSDPEISKGDRFSHLISKVYVNFTTQNGYDINSLAVRVSDVEPCLMHFASAKELAEAEENPIVIPTDMPAAKEVADLFTVSMTPAPEAVIGAGWNEILFDYDPRFKGAKPAAMEAEQDLLKAEITIGMALPNTENANSFFSWPGNRSLSESVINVLNDRDINPTGRTIITYYIKVL